MIPFVLITSLIFWVVQTRSMKKGLQGVVFNYWPDTKTVEPEQPFEVVTEVTNVSRRYIPFVKVAEHFPAEGEILSSGGAVHIDVMGQTVHTYTLYLLPRKTLTRRILITLPRRGRYFLRGATLQGGDFLGLNETSRKESLHREVVVLPKPAQAPDFQEVLGGFLGDLSVRRFIMEDPVLTTGYREYTGREPMKAIAWTQSARAGQLMVKQFDHTVEPAASVLLNVEYHNGTEDGNNAIEHCFSLARSVCQDLEGKKIKYDFFTNATAAGAFSLWQSISEGLGQRHLSAILEGLGRATYKACKPFSSIAGELAASMDPGRAVILITPKAGELDPHSLARLKEKAGGQLLILECGHKTGVMT